MNGKFKGTILHQILPLKKPTQPPNWTKIQILDGIFYQLKNGGNWEDLPKDLPPYSTVYWYYKQYQSQFIFFLDAGLIEMLSKNIDYFKSKPVNIPKITILLDNGYHPEPLTIELTNIYPQIMTKIKFELSKNTSKQEK